MRTITPLARAILITWAAQIALALGTFVAIRMAELLGWSAFRYLDRPLVFADVSKYFAFATRTAEGAVPYRDFTVEYPPLALPFLALPRLFVRSQSAFVAIFAFEMLLFDGVLVALVARRLNRTVGEPVMKRRLAWMTTGFAMLSPFAIGRYDIVPATIGFAAACAWFSGRLARGGALAAVGALVKLVPGVVALIGILGEMIGSLRPRGRGTTAFAVVMVAGVGTWLGLGGRGVADSLRYHSERGIEIGSIPCGPLWAAAKLGGRPFSVVHSHDSLNLETERSASVADRAILLQALAMGLTAAAFLIGRGRDPVRLAGAAVLAYLIGGKVLSPQYLLWVLPFLTVLEGRAGRVARPLFLLAAGLTMVIYPWGIRALPAGETWAFLVMNMRNLALVSLWGVMLAVPSGEPA